MLRALSSDSKSHKNALNEEFLCARVLRALGEVVHVSLAEKRYDGEDEVKKGEGCRERADEEEESQDERRRRPLWFNA